MLCFSLRLYKGDVDIFSDLLPVVHKTEFVCVFALKISSEWKKGVWSTVDYTQQVAGDLCFHFSMVASYFTYHMCAFVFYLI